MQCVVAANTWQRGLFVLIFFKATNAKAFLIKQKGFTI